MPSLPSQFNSARATSSITVISVFIVSSCISSDSIASFFGTSACVGFVSPTTGPASLDLTHRRSAVTINSITIVSLVIIKCRICGADQCDAVATFLPANVNIMSASAGTRVAVLYITGRISTVAIYKIPVISLMVDPSAVSAYLISAG